ncbi:hypothetical protein HPB48_004581 [Haemaphysalis longicornis]|uniref:Cytochrome P450 n=1 Tax=Haemaphysalis longicornis TaxID=44386 RepID=A0A9J6FHV8_HAELO|nr:hypothetical protein HPB48_004581 [Haemaphysalis longicornis]
MYTAYNGVFFLFLNPESFKYLQGLFKSVEDQDVTVAFYGPYPFLLASTPQVVETILGDTKNVDKAFFYDMMKPWVGGGILTLGGEPWRNRRKAITPAFHFRILDDYVPIMNKRGERLMKKVASMNGEFFNVLPISRAATLGVLFETSMGIDYDEDEIERVGYLHIHDAISDSVVNRVANFHHWFDSLYAFSSEYKEMRGTWKKRGRLSILKQSKKRSMCRSTSFPRFSVQFLLNSAYIPGLDVYHCHAQGFDTTATNIAHTLYLLGHHPEIQAKVHDEIDLVCGDDWDKPLTAEDLKNLTYMECVLKESMRLYPPAPVIGRTVTRDIQIGKYTIPRGTMAIVALYFLQRHPRFFENPDAFIPERFLETKKMPTYAFTPFSAGPRNCLGQKFSMREAKILMTHVLRRFEVTSKIPMEELVMTIELILKPIQGLEIKLIPRKHPSAS